MHVILRDLGIVASIAEMPFQKFERNELYTTIYLKAAVYFHRIIMNYPFVDGNKRTAVSVSVVFLKLNSHEVIAKKGEFEEYALRVVERHLGVKDIAKWLKSHSRKVM